MQKRGIPLTSQASSVSNFPLSVCDNVDCIVRNAALNLTMAYFCCVKALVTLQLVSHVDAQGTMELLCGDC